MNSPSRRPPIPAGCFRDRETGEVFEKVVVCRDRREWVVWDNRKASVVSRHATKADADGARALALCGKIR